MEFGREGASGAVGGKDALARRKEIHDFALDYRCCDFSKFAEGGIPFVELCYYASHTADKSALAFAAIDAEQPLSPNTAWIGPQVIPCPTRFESYIIDAERPFLDPTRAPTFTAFFAGTQRTRRHIQTHSWCEQRGRTMP
jgi:hypothetical protein